MLWSLYLLTLKNSSQKFSSNLNQKCSFKYSQVVIKNKALFCLAVIILKVKI